jgi:Protein of unknown function (DUF3224)
MAGTNRHAVGSIEMKSWDERPFAETEGAPKLARANGSDLYHGDIEGEATFEYLMMYHDDGTATYVGLERVVGRLGDRQGSFVLQISGVFEGGAVKATWFVVNGSGTGDLRGLRGTGELIWQDAQHSSVALDYDFD